MNGWFSTIDSSPFKNMSAIFSPSITPSDGSAGSAHCRAKFSVRPARQRDISFGDVEEPLTFLWLRRPIGRGASRSLMASAMRGPQRPSSHGRS